MYCIFPSGFLLAAIFYTFKQSVTASCVFDFSLYYDLRQQKSKENYIMFHAKYVRYPRLCVALFAVK